MNNTKARLEYLRGELRKECISYGELFELESLASHIDSSDVELLEAAGVPEGVSRDAIIKAWGQAEKRIGKYVNLDEDTINKFIRCPADLLVESIRSELSRR
jgi:hypothetical protein